MIDGGFPGIARLFVAGRAVAINDGRAPGDKVAGGVLQPHDGVMFHNGGYGIAGQIDAADESRGADRAIMTVAASCWLPETRRRE